MSVMLMVKNPPVDAGETRDAGSIPGSGRSPGIGNGNPVFLPGESQGRGSLVSDLAAADSMLKSRDITLPTKVCLVKTMVFPVVIYGCELDCKES